MSTFIVPTTGATNPTAAPAGAAGGQLGGTYPNPDVRGLRNGVTTELLGFGDIQEGDVLMRLGGEIVGGVITGFDEQAKVSAADTTPGYLSDKITAGSNVTLTIINPGGDEQLRIAASGGGGGGSGNGYFPGGW